MKYKLLVGSHWHQNQLHAAGAIIETDGHLDEIFPGRFEKVTEAAKETAPAPEETPLQSVDEVEKGKPKGKKLKRTKIVMCDDLFDFSPEETGLHVFRKGSRYYVYDEEDYDTVLNEKGLLKKDVLPFVKSQCEE